MTKTSTPSATPIIVLTTTGDAQEAQQIAQDLLEKGLAACVNIIPGLRSLYRWEGKICDDAEVLLLSKTDRGHFDDLAAAIRKLHSYDVPEIIAIPATAVDSAYAAWLSKALR